MGRKITAHTMTVAARSGVGRTMVPTEETWNERQERVAAERAERWAQHEAAAAKDAETTTD